MMTFEVLLTNGSVECIEGADTYGQEGPLTTFFRTDDDRRVIDSWAERLESIRTADIVRIRRRGVDVVRCLTPLREAV